RHVGGATDHPTRERDARSLGAVQTRVRIGTRGDGVVRPRCRGELLAPRAETGRTARLMAAALAGALVTAAVSTIGDYLWANVIPPRIAAYGLAHGLILFLTVGLCLGLPARKPIAGAIGGAIAGLSSAALFYVIQPVIGYATAMFVLFFALWAALGLLT